MKNYSFLIVFVLSQLSFLQTLKAQDCDVYMPQREGAKFEISSYNEKGKKTGRVLYEVLSEDEENGIREWDIKAIFFNAKDKESGSNRFQFKCKSGVFYIDLKNMVPAEQSAMANGDMQVVFEGEDMAFPSGIKSGQTLPDAPMKMKLMSGSTAIMSMEVLMKDRKVEGMEKMTTSAGTFDCYKITATSEVNSLFNYTSKSTGWYSKDVGMVRSESYDKQGKLKSYSELTLFEK